MPSAIDSGAARRPTIANDPCAAVVMAAVGGAGATTVACAMGLLAVAHEIPVTIAEFDFARGALAAEWGIPGDRTIDDLVAVADEIAQHHVTLVANGADGRPGVLLAPGRVDADRRWTPVRVGRLIDAAAALGSVIIDAGVSRDTHVLAACGRLGRVVIVAPPTIAGVRGAMSTIATIEALASAVETIIVVNRGVGRDHVSTRTFARVAGRHSIIVLPRADRDADACRAGAWPPRGSRAFRTAVASLIDRDGQR